MIAQLEDTASIAVPLLTKQTLKAAAEFSHTLHFFTSVNLFPALPVHYLNRKVSIAQVFLNIGLYMFIEH